MKILNQQRIQSLKINNQQPGLNMKKGCKCYKQSDVDHTNLKKMKFCKVLIGDSFSRCMDIPKKFMVHLKEGLSEIVKLKCPSGQTWDVGLKMIKGDIYLRYGWKSFVDAHHLQENYSLLFEYNGNSCFSVSIFDESGCERTFSHFIKNRKSRKHERVDDSIQISDASSDCGASISSSSSKMHSDILKQASLSVPNKFLGKRKAGMAPPTSSNRLKSDQDIQSLNELKGNDRLEPVETILHGNFTCRKTLMSRRRPVTEVDKSRAQQLAIKFKSVRPSFLQVMKECNVYKRFYLSIPGSFANEYLPLRNVKVILRLPRGKKKWEISYVYRDSASRFVGKWWKFSIENNLEVGDVCVFELTKDEGFAMTVHIFRVVEEVVPLILA